MNAVFFEKHGEIEALRYGSVPDPVPASGQVVVQVKACALNFLDIWVRRGWPGEAPVVDDVVYIGSSNLDIRSLLINYELVLRIPSVALADRLRAEFRDDLGRAERIDRRQWRAGRRWWQRLRSQVAYLLVARLDPYIANRRLRSLR